MALALREAHRIGLDRVRLTVEDENKISRHIIESSGGRLLAEFVSTVGQKYQLFEIALATSPTLPPLLDISF
jgi:predicted acetyltransferase